MDSATPANTRHQPNAGPMLVHRLRRWPDIGPALGRCLVFAESPSWCGPWILTLVIREITVFQHVSDCEQSPLRKMRTN